MITFYRAFGIFINLVEFLIVIRIILSIIGIGFDNFIGKIIYDMTEPILSPARNLLAKLNINTGIFDFSPILAIIILRLIYNIIGRILFF